MMSYPAPVRDTKIPKNPEISVGALLKQGDIDRLATSLHALLEEVADLSVRLAQIEAKLAGKPEMAPADLKEIQAHVAKLVDRVIGQTTYLMKKGPELGCPGPFLNRNIDLFFDRYIIVINIPVCVTQTAHTGCDARYIYLLYQKKGRQYLHRFSVQFLQ